MGRKRRKLSSSSLVAGRSEPLQKRAWGELEQQEEQQEGLEQAEEYVNEEEEEEEEHEHEEEEEDQEEEEKKKKGTVWPEEVLQYYEVGREIGRLDSLKTNQPRSF